MCVREVTLFMVAVQMQTRSNTSLVLIGRWDFVTSYYVQLQHCDLDLILSVAMALFAYYNK